MECLKAKEVDSHSQLPQPEEPRRGTTFLKTCFNGLNALSGVGILSIPYALSQGGWLSLILLFLVAVLCWYTGLLLKRCMDSDPLIRSYPDIGEKAFGYKGRVVVSIFMYLELYLVAVEFLILEGDNLYKLFPNAGFKLAGLYIGGKTAFVLLTALVILPTTWLKSLGMLAYVSAGGVSASIILVGCVLWVGAVDGVGFHEDGLTCQLRYKYRHLWINGSFRATSFNPLTKYAVITAPIATAIEETFVFRDSRYLSILVRTVIVISTVVVALAIPFFGYVMAFTGAFFSVTVSMLLPCLCYLRIDKSARSFGLELVFIVGILMIGSFVARGMKSQAGAKNNM
ncbi:hypothetical protein OIU74_022056 [Salix koriyanagi]|uniref:Amino acid transporter transmembrane domain-containing protein n=1 Tax=Salix koriyanagi TaxID=2511006 RepID=A0A9Q0WJE9_9ROSI|nr:hypothetical protein OIU74_022056 [Salix koriyanagi]